MNRKHKNISILNRLHISLALGFWLLTAAIPQEVRAQKLSVEKQTIDVGRTGYEVPVTAVFELRNKGLRKLVINEVKPDCGCTRAELSRREVGPGDKFTLTLTYDARMLGHFEKQVALYSNATKAPVYLKMKGLVLADYVDFSSSHPFDFGGLLADKSYLEFDDVNKGDMPTQEISIVNNTLDVITPNVQHLPSYLSAYSMPEQLQPGQRGQVVITLNSSQLNSFGLTQSTVHLAKQLGERVQSESEVGVSVVLLPNLTEFEGERSPLAPQLALSDSIVAIGEFGSKSKKSGEIIISNNGRSALSITSLQMFTPGLRVTLTKRELQPGEQARLKVTAFRDELQRARTLPRVLMITNDPKHPKVVIRVK